MREDVKRKVSTKALAKSFLFPTETEPKTELSKAARELVVRPTLFYYERNVLIHLSDELNLFQLKQKL